MADAAQALTASPLELERNWKTPDRGVVGIICLIVTESSLFLMFVVTYIIFIGRSLNGPYPKDVLGIPYAATVCLLSSSLTVYLGEHALVKSQNVKQWRIWWAVTIALGLAFLIYTGLEWERLIYDEHLNITTNVFGTTFYSLVGLHASHVFVGLVFLCLSFVASMMGFPIQTQTRRMVFLSWYWHFVDAIWVIVFSVVYILGK